MRRPLFVAAAFAFAVAVPAFAQDPPFEHVQIVETTVKIGRAAEYEQLAKRLSQAQLKADPSYTIIRYAVGAGGAASSYVSARPFTKWGDMDKWVSNRDAVVKAYGEAEGAKLLAALDAVAERRQVTVASVWKGMNVWRAPAAGQQYRMLRVTEQEIDRARLADYSTVIQRRSEEMRKLGTSAPLVRYLRSVGPGSVTTMFNVTYANNYAAFDTPLPDLPKAIGEPEWGRQVRVTQEAIRASSTYFLIHRPDLSFGGDPATSSR